MNHILPTATTSGEKKRDADCAVLPVGSFEQHGDYLLLITDTVIASVVSRELASAYSLLQLPPVTISCSHEHSARRARRCSPRWSRALHPCWRFCGGHSPSLHPASSRSHGNYHRPGTVNSRQIRGTSA